MAQTLKLKRTSVANKVPTTSNIEVAELAFNTNDKALFIRGDNDAIVTLHDEDTLHIAHSTNRVGIGTTSPNTTLTVDGDVRIRDSIASLYLQDSDGTNQVLEIKQSAGASTISARNGTSNGSIRFTGFNGTSSTEYARFNNSGLFGIGTTAPSEELHVSKASGGNTIIRIDSLDAARNNFIGITGHDNLVLAADHGNEGADSSIRMSVDGTERLRIDDSGHVGIGTTSPSGELHVSNSSDFYTDLDGTDSAVVFKEGGGNSWRIGNRASGDKFNITQDASSLGTNVRFTIDDGGHVGIGETSPDKQLHIKDSGAVGIAIESTDNAQNLDLDFYNNGGSVAGRIRYAEGPGAFSFFPNAGATEVITLAYAGGITFNSAYTFPTSDGSANQVLQTDGSGNLSFATVQAGGGGTVSEAFKNIAVSGQSSVVADGATDTLTLAAGTGMTITTNATSDTITFAASTTTFEDSDGDTKIQVEESSDEDKIRFDAGGTERFRIGSDVEVISSTDLNINGTSRRINFTAGTGTVRTTTAQSLILATNSTTALTLDSSQNATFAGTISSGQVNATTSSDATAAIIATNTGGVSSIIQRWVGDSDALDVRCINTGDYQISNSQQTNGIDFYDGTGGLAFRYNNAVVAQINSGGGFDLVTGSYKINSTVVIDSSRNLTNIGTISSGAITSSGTLKSTSATGLIIDTGAAYRDVKFELTGNTGNGTLEIIPMTVPGSGTATFTTHIKNLAATGTTNHNLKVDGTITSGGRLTGTELAVTNIVTNKVAKFNGTIIDDSNITDTGSLITLGSNTAVSGNIALGGNNITDVNQIDGTGASGWLDFNMDTDSVYPQSTTDNQTVLGSVTHMNFVGDSNANGTGGIFNFGFGVSSTDGGSFTRTATLNRSGDLDIIGQLTVGSGDNIVNAGNMTVDVAGDLTLDADGGDIFLKDGGTQFGRMANFLGSLVITSGASDTAIIIGDNSGNMIVGGDVSLTDNKKLKLGAGNDLQIYHDATHSYIDNNTGSLYISSTSSVQIEDNSGNDMITAGVGGAVTLFHNGSAKLATTSTGINVTGNAVFNSSAKVIFGGDDTYNAHLQYTDNGSGDHFFSIKTEHDDTITERAKFHAGTGAITFTGNTTFANNLSVTGDISCTGDILAKDNNSTTNPSITFTGHTDSGIGISDYGNGTDRVSIIRDGSATAYFDQAGITSTGNLYTATNSTFRNYSGTWQGTTGTTGKGFRFVNTADSVTAMDLSASGNVVFAGEVEGASLDINGVADISGNLTVGGNLTVNGTTTTLNTATLDVEDKNITLNKGSGDTSGSANGAGITIQDAVNASTDATLLWNASNDAFDFSHKLNIPTLDTGTITNTGNLSMATDNATIFLGAGLDLRLYHDGSNSYIKDQGTGQLILDGDGVILQHSTATKLQTTSTGATVTGNIVVSGTANIGAYKISDTSTNTSATTEATIDSFTSTAFRSCRYTVQVTNNTDSTYHTTELLLVHDGTTPGITEFGTIFTGAAAEATFDADISSGSVRLRATPASTDSMTFKVIRHAITT